MQFRYTILYVEDVAEAAAFYAQAFGFAAKMVHESGDYAELDTGATTLAFSARRLMRELGKTPAEADAHRPVFEIAFETEDVAAAVQKAVSAGAVLMKEPAEMPWGQTVAYVADRSGFLIEICTPVPASS
jgi:lactoylglutathione lyase